MTGHLFQQMICLSCNATINVPVYCGDRFCEVCSITRLLRIRHRIAWLIDNATKPAGYTYKHITLTISSQPDLPRMIRYIQKSFAKLRNRQLWKSKVDGGAYVIEITGRPGRWHAHLHIIAVSRWLDWEQLVKCWRKCSGSQGVFLSDIPKNDCVRYLTKYLTKPDMPESVGAEVSAAMKGCRMFAPIGSWFALNKLYVKPKTACSHCGGLRWTCIDFLYDRYPRSIWMVKENGLWVAAPQF